MIMRIFAVIGKISVLFWLLVIFWAVVMYAEGKIRIEELDEDDE